MYGEFWEHYNVSALYMIMDKIMDKIFISHILVGVLVHNKINLIEVWSIITETRKCDLDIFKSRFIAFWNQNSSYVVHLLIRF